MLDAEILDVYAVPWHPKMPLVQKTIQMLYSINDGTNECALTGGMCHVVVDDNNLLDYHLESTIEYCKENPDRMESEIGICICTLLSKLTVEQRVIVFGIMYEGYDIPEYYEEYSWKEILDKSNFMIQHFYKSMQKLVRANERDEARAAKSKKEEK